MGSSTGTGEGASPRRADPAAAKLAGGAASNRAGGAASNRAGGAGSEPADAGAPPRPPAAARRRRDRRGRGLRGPLVPAGVPAHRTPAQAFDELVLEAVERLSPSWSQQLALVDFAVEDVPDVAAARHWADLDDPDVVADADVPLGRAVEAGRNPAGRSLIVLYRRPLEARAIDEEDLADLILDVVVDRFAHLLGRDPDEIDPLDEH
ncbi:MAG: metallopeptidase family protein [Frankiaceae bacterium]|jgi:predicted Zn-dependent protease with MMP-like domain|nr:metallopeptidase family protein [Frankiaceae bacterium]